MLTCDNILPGYMRMHFAADDLKRLPVQQKILFTPGCKHLVALTWHDDYLGFAV